MNRKIKHLFKIIFVTFVIMMMMAVSPKTFVSAEVADGFEFYVGNADGDKLISTEAFNTEALSYGDVELFLWARSIGTVKHIGAFQLLFEFNDQLAINSGLTVLQTLTYVDGRDTKTGPTYMVINDNTNPNFFSISKNIDTAAKAKLSDYNVPLEGVKVAKFYVKIKSGTPITEDNIQIKANVPTAANSSGVQYQASSLVSTPMIIGSGIETTVSADIENVKVSGMSGSVHYDSSVGETPAINQVTVSYKDAQQPLSLSITKTSGSALVTQSGATAPYKTGDKITLFVVDGEGESFVSKTYELTLTVSAANSSNTLSNLTINKGQMSPAFSPEVTEYNVDLTYIQSDLTINAYINPEDLSQLNKTTISKSFNVGTTVETFVVTAENGTQKTYTINVNREAPSGNKNITSVFVSGNEATFNGDVKYSYVLPEASTNFSFKVLLEDQTSTIQYKKSTDSTYINLAHNTNSQTITISYNQTIDLDVKVTAQDGTYEMYIVSVLRSPSTNTTLSSVKVVEGLSTNSVTPVSGVYKYTLSSSGEDEIQILTTIDPLATVKLVDSTDQELTNMIINTSTLGVGTHLYRIIVTAQDSVTTQAYNVEIVKKSDLKEIVTSSITDRDNGYQVISFEAGDYEYNSSTYTYIYRFDYKYSRIRYQLTTSLKSTITADGFKPGALANEGYFDITLSDTTQTLSINVLAEDGSVRQYTVSFVRRAADTKNKLDDLKVNGTTVDGFSPTKFNGYDRIIFEGTTTSVFVEGVLEDGSKATIKYNGGTSQQVSLTRGVVKTVSILVTAENGTSNTYTLEIVAANTDNSIQNITFDNINFSFDPGVTSYTLNVPFTNTLTSVTVNTPAGANSVVTGMGAKSLAVGNNTLVVYAVSEAGVKGAEYVFNITRNQARTENILQSLTVGSYALTPSFSSSVLNYSVRVDNQITEVTVSAQVPLDNGSRIISGPGKYTLTSGATKTVSILVESESGVIKTYTVDILRANDIYTFNSITIGGQVYLPSHFDLSRELHLSSLPFATKFLPVSIQKTDEFATVTAPKLSLAGNWDLVAGENVFTFNVTSQAGTVGQTYTVYVTVNEPNTNNDLTNLEVLLGETNLLVDSQAFSASKLTYQIRVDANITELTINASVNPALNSTFTGAGVKTLSLTTQTFNVVVTAENGVQKTYIIEVTRKNDNNKIDDIVIDNFESIVYKNDQYTYSLGTVSFSTKSISFDILLNDSRAKLYVNNQEVGRVSTYTLKQGLNTITVHAVSEFGTKGQTYTYTITQEIAKTNASLSDLDVMAGTTNLLADSFDPAVLSYTMRVDRSVTQVQLFATLITGEHQTLSGDTGNQPLSVGVNTFRVTVTAEDGVTKQTYLIEITRKNDIHDIQNITVDGKSISFDQETLTYTLESVLFTKQSVVILATPTDSYAVVTGNGTMTLKDGSNSFTVYATSEFGTKGTVYTINIERHPANTENKLSDLEVVVEGSDVLIGDQAFDASKNLYKVRVNNEITSLTINATVNPLDRSTVTGAGSKTLQLGLNTFNVKVTAEDGTENIYVIEVTRANDVNDIENIEVGSFESVIFSKTTYSYTLGNVPFSTKTLVFDIETLDTSAKLYINGGLQTSPYTYTLKQGLNTISVYAVSEFGTKGQTYTYTVTQEIAKTNANLSDLDVMAGATNLLADSFDETILSYTLRVDRSVSQIQINPTLKAGQYQTLSGDTGNQPISVGVNTFRVTVTAEDGITKQTYLIEVTRKNDNNTIQNITVDGESISFDQETLTYTLAPVLYTKQSINITAVTADSYAVLTGTGVMTLKDGLNSFTVFATSEFGTKGTVYTINIERQQANTLNKLSDLEVLVNGVDLLTGDQAFDKDKNLYQIRVNNTVTSLVINASVNPLDRSTVTGAGTKTLSQPTHSFKVTVTSENGIANDYVIEVTRKNNNYNILNIVATGYPSVIFNTSNYTYDLGHVPYTVKNVNFNVTLEDASAVLLINGVVANLNSTHLLTSGLNTFEIKARSEFGEESSVYTYTIYQDEANDVAELNLLEAIVGTTDLLQGLFSKDDLMYEIRVDRNISQIKINASADPLIYATVSGNRGTFPLAYGLNTFSINVVAEDGVTSQTYTIKVLRANDNNEITSIMVNGVLVPGFDPDVTTYELPNYTFDVKTVNLTATLGDTYAKLTGTGVITLVDGSLEVKVYATSEAGTKGNEYTIIFNRTAAFTDTSLQNLVVSSNGTPLTFEEGSFTKSRTGYTIKLDPSSTITSIDILAELLDARQTLSGNTGNQLLTINQGVINQTFTVTVTAENGAQKTYSITVLKGSNLSSDASINRVTLTDLSGNQYLTFNPLLQVQQEIVLDYQTSVISLNVVPNNQNAIVVGGGTFTINPNQTVTLKFQVIAQDGVTTSLNYEVKVRRQVASDDNQLSSLEVLVNGTDLLIDHNAFSPTKYTYTLKVDRSVTLIDIQAVANHVGAKVSGDINQVALAAGLQQLRVFVTAESGAQRTYYINIEVVNSEIELISLSVDHFLINFDKDTYSYDLGEVSSNYTSLNIKALISNLSYGTLSGDLGVVALKYGLNVFTVTATSEDQSMVETYQIFATRLEPSANNYLLDLYVTDGTYILPFDNAVFNRETGFYQIILDKTSKVSSIVIFATAENGTTPTGTGQFLLTSIAGVIKNDFFVTVTAANGEVRSYQIQVIKSDSSHLSGDNSIKAIEISTANGTYEVNFNPENVIQEPIVLDYKDSSFFVDITAAQGATIVGRDLYKLNAGETKKIYFQVTAENGDIGLNYELEITRSLPDSNNTASSLKVLIDGETIELDVTKNEHFLDIPNTISTIGIDATITDTQTITGLGNKTISLDTHKFYVVVTAQDGTPNVYMIQTTRRSNDSTLKSIKLDGVEMFGQFSGNILTLADVLYEVSELDILATATSLKAVVSGNGLKNLKVGLNRFEVYATSELGEVGEIYAVEITRLAPSSDATLKSLVVKNNATGTPIDFLPVFNPTTMKYTIALSLTDQVSEILIDATANSNYITSVDGLGVYTLKAASSQTTEIFTITVVAEDNSSKTYEIHVTRDLEPEDDITIDHLSLFGGTINYLGTTEDAIQSFSSSTYAYNILVPYQLGSINLSITNLNGASIIGAGNHVLVNGTTVIEFYLVSKSGLVRSEDYTITITKQQPSSDNTLKSLSVDQKLITGFSPSVLTYQLQVTLEDVSKLNISAIANHPYATVIGDLGEVDLVAGTNTINVRVIAEDLSVKTYQIVVSRLSGNNTLQDLYVLGQTLNYPFNQERIRYEVRVPYTTEYVEIGAVAHEKANVINMGIKYLEVGDNVYEVYAIAENGIKGKTYEVHVIREEVSNDSSLLSLVIRDAVTNNLIGFAPEFRPSTLEYIIVLDKESPVTSLIIEGVANSLFASVGGNGYKVLKAKVDGDYHNVFEVTVRAQDQTTTTYTISVYKDVNLSDSTTISKVSLIGSDGVTYLATTDGNITFSPNQYLYLITVPYHLTSMTLDIRSDSATPYGIGTKTFDSNEMVFEAYLVSQSGINQTDDYVIRITREDAVVENQLANMTLNGKAIDGFDPDKTYYEMNIPYLSITNLALNATPLDPTAKVSGDIGTHNLKEGKNVYTITVTAQNGDLKTYTVVVNYNNVNAFLDDLKVINPETEESYPFTFNPNTFTYRVNVGKNDEEVLITGRAQDQSYAAIIGLGRYQVNENGTTAMINVIASDNSTVLTYTIEIIREERASNNTRLKSMSISGQNVTFNPDTLTYVISVNNAIDALDVIAEAESSVASVKINGADDIVQGRNVIMIEVTAEDGTVGYYTVVVNKDAAPNNFLTMLLIISLLVWIITVLIFLIRASRDKKYYKKNLIR